ncbi:MAG: hypothetical protein ACFNUB_02725 [Candidatus Saccharibacteria bacterium]
MLNINNNSSEALSHCNEDLSSSQSVYKIDTKFLEQVSLDPSIKDLASNVDKSDSLVTVSKIYHRLCKTLRYDQAAFLSLGNGAKLIHEVDKHRDPRFISQVSIDRNEVICNDFSVIFAKLALSMFPNILLSIRETYTGMSNDVMHISSIVDGTDIGRLEADPLASFTRSDFLRARLGLLPIGLRSANASISPDDTYYKYHNWNDPSNLDKLLEIIQEDIRSFELPAVEAASFAKGALRTAIGRVGYKVRVSNCEHDNNLVSTYTLTGLSNEEISKISLSEGALKNFN